MKEGYQYEIGENEYIEQQKCESQVAITFLNNLKDVMLKVMDVAMAQHQTSRMELTMEKVCNKLDDIAFKMSRHESEPKNYSK